MKSLALKKHLLAAAAALLAMNAQAITLDGNNYTCTGTCGQTSFSDDVTQLDGTYGYVTTSESTAVGGLLPPVDRVLAGDLTNGSVAVSNVFSSNGTINASFNFVSTDGDGFGDIAWARVIDATNNNPTNNTVAWLFTARATNSGSGNVVPGDLQLMPTSTILNYGSYSFNERILKDGDAVNWAPLGSTDGNPVNGNGTCWDEKANGCGFTGWLNAQVTVAAGNYRLEVGVVNFADTLYDSGLAFNVATLAAPVPEPGTAPMMLAALGAFGFFARRRMSRGV